MFSYDTLYSKNNNQLEAKLEVSLCKWIIGVAINNITSYTYENGLLILEEIIYHPQSIELFQKDYSNMNTRIQNFPKYYYQNQEFTDCIKIWLFW